MDIMCKKPLDEADESAYDRTIKSIEEEKEELS